MSLLRWMGLALVAGLVTLVAWSTAEALDPQDEAPDYEAQPVCRARDLLPAELLSGPITR